MRAVLLSCVLCLGLPVLSLAEDAPAPEASAASPDQVLADEQLQEIVELIDAWFEARAQDEQIRLQDIDERMSWWCRNALEDPALQAAMAPEDEPIADVKDARRKRRKDKSRKPSDALPSTDDLMDTTLGVDHARLGAVITEVLDAQPRFARMEATGVDFLQKKRQLKELRALAQAELAAESAAAEIAAAEGAAAESAAPAEDAPAAATGAPEAATVAGAQE